MTGEDFANALPAGTRIGPVVLVRPIGQGAWGIVYEGLHDYWHRVAVKEFFPSSYAKRTASNGVGSSAAQWQDAVRKGLARFTAEGQALRSIRYENVVPVLDFVDQDGSAFLVMEFIDGETLGSAIEAGRFCDSASVMALGATLVGTLAAIHAKNILHRDIAPDNIMIRPDGTPVLIDFGGAAAAVASATRSTQNIVKDGYSPPEQYDTSENAAFPIGPWSDIYATAAVLYRLVTGREPPVSNTRLLSSGIRGQSDPLTPLKAQPASDYPAPWLAAVDAALALVPADRPQSAVAWQRQFEGVSLQRNERRAAWPLFAAAAATLTVIVSALAAFFIVHDQKKTAIPQVAAIVASTPAPPGPQPKRSVHPATRPLVRKPTSMPKAALSSAAPSVAATPRVAFVPARPAPVASPHVVYVQATPRVVFVPAQAAPVIQQQSAVDPVVGLWKFANGYTWEFLAGGDEVARKPDGSTDSTAHWVRTGDIVTINEPGMPGATITVTADGKSIMFSNYVATRIR